MYGLDQLRYNNQGVVLSGYSAGEFHKWFPGYVNFLSRLSSDPSLQESFTFSATILTPRTYDLPEEYCVDPLEGWVYTGKRQTLADLTEMELYDELDKAMEVISKEEYLRSVEYAIPLGLSIEKVKIALEGPGDY